MNQKAMSVPIWESKRFQFNCLKTRSTVLWSMITWLNSAPNYRRDSLSALIACKVILTYLNCSQRTVVGSLHKNIFNLRFHCLFLIFCFNFGVKPLTLSGALVKNWKVDATWPLWFACGCHLVSYPKQPCEVFRFVSSAVYQSFLPFPSGLRQLLQSSLWTQHRSPSQVSRHPQHRILSDSSN